MNILSKEDKIVKILEKIKIEGHTGYELAKKLNLSQSGLDKFLRGESKNPHNSTIEKLYDYLFNSKTVSTVEHKIEIDGNLCKLSSISSAVMNNEKLFMENDRGFQLFIADLVNHGVKKVLEENGIKVSYSSEGKNN